LLHISTDFVFDGRSYSPYRPTDATGPLGVYGATKLAGEQAVLKTLGHRATVVRTAWVYAAQGRNFLRTMLRLMNERGAVRVVADQIGTPTAAPSLAEVLWKFAARPDQSGVFHWADSGVASWYDFAVAIAEEGAPRGLINRVVQVTPVTTAEYPAPAARPAFSVLDKRSTLAALDIVPVHWRAKLRLVMDGLAVA
jgi:dTDP-4-dehydrorhamnose reductase